MLKSFGLIILFIAIAYFHIRKLAKEKLIREIWIFSILMFFVTSLTVAKINNVPIPNPLELVIITMEPLNRMFEIFSN
jgi:hypothetical protein